MPISNQKFLLADKVKRLAEKIAADLWCAKTWAMLITSTYSDGEFQPSLRRIYKRNSNLYNWRLHNPGPENLMEMLLMLDAAKRASARHITAVLCLILVGQDKIEKINQECQLLQN